MNWLFIVQRQEHRCAGARYKTVFISIVIFIIVVVVIIVAVKGKKRKVKVYSLVSRAKCHSLNFTQLILPRHRSCSYISHLNSPGSIQPGCHFRRTELFKHTSLHCPKRYPLTLGSRECTCGRSTLPRSTTSGHNSAQPGIEPVTSS